MNQPANRMNAMLRSFAPLGNANEVGTRTSTASAESLRARCCSASNALPLSWIIGRTMKRFAVTNDVTKYLIKADAAPTYGPREPRPSKLDGFKPYIEERLKAGGLERTCAAAGVARAWLCR